MDFASQLSGAAANFHHVLPESFNYLFDLLVSSIRIILIIPFIILTALTSFFMFSVSCTASVLRIALIISFRVLTSLYVTYQFLMMLLNITCTLLILKTSTFVRNETRAKNAKSQQEKKTHGRHIKEWTKELDAISTFNDFLGIEIDEPADVALGSETNMKSDCMFDMQKKSGCSSSFEFTNAVYPTGVFKRQSSSDDLPLIEKNASGLGNVGFSLINTTRQLEELRKKASETEKSKGEDNSDDATSSLKLLLTDIMKRNHLSINDLLREDARSVAECGRHKLNAESRRVIYEYNEEVECCLNWLADQPCLNNNDSTHSLSSTESTNSDEGTFQCRNALKKEFSELNDRVALICRLKQNLGNTALLLSGGGSLALYHTGTLKALIESNLYDDIQVITGASGGSIVAGLCAILSPQEVLKEVCVNTCAIDFNGSGEMKKQNIRWFPRAVDMAKNLLEHKVLVDPAEFKKCCNFYYGDVTFEEAFARTKKHVCITVSANRSNGASGSGDQRLLLNHISTPNVTIASAVVASCALPGVMAPAKLYTKSKKGKLELFEEDDLQWVDGSIQADLPFQRIAMLFNVSNYIVCQTNPHVVPFMHKAHHPGFDSFHWKLLKTCEGDIRSRMIHMSRLDLLPKLAGQDISKVFEQKYHGDLTIVPRFPTTHMLGLTVLANPTVEHMNIYLQRGQSATWPFVGCVTWKNYFLLPSLELVDIWAMQEMLRHERVLKNILTSLQEQIRSLGSEYGFHLMVGTARHNSLRSHSATSTENRAYFLTSDNEEHEMLEKTIKSLEQENEVLRTKLAQVDRVLGNRKSMESCDEFSGDADFGWDDEIFHFIPNESTTQKKRMTVA